MAVRNPEDRVVSVRRNVDKCSQQRGMTKVEFGAIQDRMTVAAGALTVVSTARPNCLYKGLGGKGVDVSDGRCTINGDSIFHAPPQM